MSRLFCQAVLRTAVKSLPQQPAVARQVSITGCSIASLLTPGNNRSFSSLPSLRPTLPGASPSTIFRPSCPSLLSRLPTATSTAASQTAAGAPLDLVPKTSISAHPALGSMQIRCGPRPNMNRPSRLIQKRRHGFLSRIRTNKGVKTLKRRQAKGRKRLSY